MYEKLFEPIEINHCRIPNRLAVTAMVVEYNNSDGTLTDRYIRYFEEKAKGGWGLLITEDYAVTSQGRGWAHIGGLWDDSQLEGHKKLIQTVHQYDSKIFAQIYHAGRQSSPAVNGGVEIVAPSAIPCPWNQIIPHELTIEEIQEIVKAFGKAAGRAKEAGYDGIELHCAHGYLLAEFLSQYANKRYDEYGGPLKNRMRIVHEIYDEIRKNVGEDYPVMVRFSADEGVIGGREISETRVLAKNLEQWGFNALHVSVGVYGDFCETGSIASHYMNHAYAVKYAEEVKKIVNIPVITVDRINDPEMADQLIALGKADMVGMGRGSLADPHLPNKAKNGDEDSIRYCIGCLQGCAAIPKTGVTCLVNPSVGIEYRCDYTKTNNPKKIFVAGGGPGGLEFARAAATKGHEVTLFEKSSHLGGQFRSAAFPATKGDIASFIGWEWRELKKLNVSIRMETTLTREVVEQEKPDIVIDATGGVPRIPQIEGIDLPHVMTAEDALVGNADAQGEIVILGGGETACETAEFLASLERGRVTVLSSSSEILRDLDGVRTVQLKALLKKYGVVWKTNTDITKITENEVFGSDKNGEVSYPADAVIIAKGYVANTKLAEELKDSACALYSIGEAGGSTNALQAIRDGFDLALQMQ